MANKYLAVFRMNWQAGLAYPLSFSLWRLRQILSTIMSLTVWTVIYAQQTSAFGYNRSEMLSYIFLVSLLQGAILATNLHGLAGDIYGGAISQLLLKPVRLFRYFAAIEVADKLKNCGLIVGESLILFFIFKPSLVLPDLWPFLLFLLWVVAGILIHFFIEILFGTLGFWSPQTWGPKFLFFILVDVTAGKLFPLDILPELLQKALYFTPFPYLAYAQSQLFLGRISPTAVLPQTAAIVFWLVFLGFAATLVWNKGIKDFSAAGQ